MEVKVPDIGDFKDVPVISILVAVGDEVAEDGWSSSLSPEAPQSKVRAGDDMGFGVGELGGDGFSSRAAGIDVGELGGGDMGAV